MSSISSMTSDAQLTMLQQLQQRGQSGSVRGAGFQAQRKAEFSSALKAAGVDPSKIDDIQKQIDEAVQKARQNGAAGPGNRAAFRSAVETVLKNNGVDVAKFQQVMKAQHAKHAGHAHQADGDGDADDGGSAPSVNESTETDPASNPAKALLQSLLSGTTTQRQASGLPAGSFVDVAA